MSEYDLPVPDDAPWLNLSPEEMEELRKQKYELSQYGKEKIRELMNDGKLRVYDKGKETFAVEDPYWGKCQNPETLLHIKEMTHEEMLPIAAEREAINAKVSEEDYQKVLDATKQAMDNYKPEPPKALSEMSREERVEAGIQEIWWIVQGGQDGREYANSIAFVIQVLDSLRTLN